MAGRYVLTPRRRAALKRAQVISARKRKGTGKARRFAKGVAIGGGLVAVGTAAYIAQDKVRYKTYYHGTSKTAQRNIVKNKTFQSHKKENGNVFFYDKPKYDYGHHSVKVKVKRKQAKRVVKSDPSKDESNAFYINRNDMRGVKIKKGPSQAKKKRRLVNPYRADGTR